MRNLRRIPCRPSASPSSHCLSKTIPDPRFLPNSQHPHSPPPGGDRAPRRRCGRWPGARARRTRPWTSTPSAPPPPPGSRPSARCPSSLLPPAPSPPSLLPSGLGRGGGGLLLFLRSEIPFSIDLRKYTGGGGAGGKGYPAHRQGWDVRLLFCRSTFKRFPPKPLAPSSCLLLPPPSRTPPSLWDYSCPS